MALHSAATIKNAFLVQYRVILALILREVHTIYGHTHLGYIWALIQTASNVVIFWVMREFMKSTCPHGMSVASYLIIGFGITTIITSGISKCLTAVESNKSLLSFPQVTEFDVMLARIIVLFTTEIIVVIILLGIASIIHEPIVVYDYGTLYLCLLMIFIYALGLGMLFASLAVFVPVLKQLMQFVIRFLFFTSGAFFSPSSFSYDIAEIMMLNPISHLTEFCRHAFHPSYVVDNYSWMYVIIFGITSLSLGLLLERYARTRRDR